MKRPLRIHEIIARQRLRRREKSLYRDFIAATSADTLERLIGFAEQHDLHLRVDRDEVREALLSLDWAAVGDELAPEQRESVFQALDDYLFGSPSDASGGAWLSWIRMSRAAARVLPVTEPKFASGLLAAKRLGILDGLPKPESDYLLSCYLRAYGNILDRSEAGNRHVVLPILLEFAAIAQVLGPSPYSSAILRKWMKHARLTPRPLTRLSDEEAYDAPIRGVGSPNGASVTLFMSSFFGVPARIAYAGVTGDKTLNAQLFSGLFAAALASDDDRSFLTSIGGVLHLNEAWIPVPGEQREALLSAVLGPNEFPDPQAGIPTLGMTPGEAFELISELFQRFDDSTGLVSVKEWGLDDVAALEERIKTALAKDGESALRLRSQPGHSEEGGIIHVMPLLHRNPDGTVEPVQIPVSCSTLNPELVLKLTSTARQSYMMQLIANGRRREAMARNAYEEQSALVDRWQALDEAEKEEQCRVRPWVEITQAYNFELGLISPVDPPEQVSHREYEEVQRPALRDSAKQYAERFRELCAKLEHLNRPGGNADALTQRFLIDAAIRGDSVLITESQFASDYKTWLDRVSASLWAPIEDWASRRGYPMELMAADNVVFNSRFSQDGLTVWIQPHILLDMHDFEIIVDRHAGMMFTFPGGGRPGLKEKMITAPEYGITDPVTLHQQFCTWADAHLELSNSPSKGDQIIRKKIMADKRMSGLILLEKGKRLLFKGEIAESMAVFDKIRRSDLAAAYFWGAAARQFQFLHEYRLDPGVIGNMDESEKRKLLLDLSVQILINSLKTARPKGAARGRRGGSIQEEQLLAGSMTPDIPLDHEAGVFLNQLRARDPQFVEGLTQEVPDIAALEAASLDMTEDEEVRLRAAMFALSSLDFLSLAEAMKTLARSMPFARQPTTELRKELQEIAELAQTMPFVDPPGAAQIEELTALLGRADHGG